MSASARPTPTTVMRVHFIHLGLLVRRECLEKRSLCLGVRCCHLCGQAADGVGSLLNTGGVILLDGRLQGLVRRAHLVMESFSVISSFSKDGGGLLLLLRGQ